MLLVLLAPFISRAMNHSALGLAPAVHAPSISPTAADHDGSATAHAEHHDHHHHHHDHADALHAPAEKASPADPHAHHEMGVECDYCLIAARLLTFAVAFILALLLLPQVCQTARRSLEWYCAAPSSQLGARGPPLAA